MEKQLLIEYNTSGLTTYMPRVSADNMVMVNEATKTTDDGFYYLDGLFLQGEVKNRNGRVYPREEIAKAVKTLSQNIKEHGPVPGELDHPDGFNLNFDRLAVAITDIRMEGNNGMGRMRVVPEGLGKILEGAIRTGIQVGVSSRGAGYVGPDGRVSDYEIVTVDAVLEPSAPGAYPELSMAEQVIRAPHGIETLSLTEAAKNDPAAKKHLEKAMRELFTALRDDVTWR